MDYFAQNGLQVDAVRQDDPPEDGNIFTSAVKGIYDFFTGEEEKEPKKKVTLSPEEMQFIMSVSDPDGTEYTGRYDTPSAVTPIKRPIQQSQVQTQQPQGGSAMPTSAERKVIQRWYESSNNPSADSGYAGGLYGIAEGALTDAINDGIVPRGSNIYDAEVNEKVRDYYIDKMYNAEWVKNATTNVSRLARAYSAYNQGGGRAVDGWNAAKAAGFDINPSNAEELVALMDAKGGGKYDGYFWPKETRDYVKGIVAGQFDPSRLPEGFQLGNQ